MADKNLKKRNEVKQIREERLKKIHTYLEQIPDEKYEGILIGFEMLAALYKSDFQNHS